MFTLVQYRNMYNAAIEQYVVDTPMDIETLPTDGAAGSKAFVIENSTYYMLNHEKKWIKVKLSSGQNDSTEEVIYEGGVI